MDSAEKSVLFFLPWNALIETGCCEIQILVHPNSA